MSPIDRDVLSILRSRLFCQSDELIHSCRDPAIWESCKQAVHAGLRIQVRSTRLYKKDNGFDNRLVIAYSVETEPDGQVRSDPGLEKTYQLIGAWYTECGAQLGVVPTDSNAVLKEFLRDIPLRQRREKQLWNDRTELPVLLGFALALMAFFSAKWWIVPLFGSIRSLWQLAVVLGICIGVGFIPWIMTRIFKSLILPIAMLKDPVAQAIVRL